MRTTFSERSVCFGVFLVSAVLHVGFSTVGLAHSLFQIHAFRQLQTALTARAIQEQGWSLAYPTPLFGPPWSVPMEFPVYQFCVARFSSLLGLPLETAGRLIALFFFYAALPACFGLAGMIGLPRPRRWLFLAILLLTPAYLYYSRSFMIESTALCAALWFLWAYCRGLEQGSSRWLGLAAACGAVASVTKVTTFLIVLFLAALFTLMLLWRRFRAHTPRWPLAAFVGLATVLPSAVAAIAWVRYSDAVKLTNPLTVSFTSAALTNFNFGPWLLRFSADFWARIHTHTTVALLPDFNLWVILIFGILLARRHRLRLVLPLVGFLVGPLVFANLYYVHDYYFYANGVFLAAALALALDQLLDSPQFPALAKAAVVGLSLACQLTGFLFYYFTAQRIGVGAPPEIASVLAETTAPQDVVLIFGQDWDASVPYTAHRRAIMIVDNKIDDKPAINEVLSRVPPGAITALIASGPIRRYPGYLAPYLGRLKLHPEPFVLNSETALYLSEERFAAAAALQQSHPLKEFQHVAAPIAGDYGIPRTRTDGPAISDSRVLSVMNLVPRAILHPFGLGTNELDGHTVLNAHAPTDVIFTLPSGATTMDARFGILPAAYTGGNHSAGVEFVVELVTPDGHRQQLVHRFLSPDVVESDRGEKSFHVPIPAGATGELWFRALPGATGSIACAWAYIARIDLR